MSPVWICCCSLCSGDDMGEEYGIMMLFDDSGLKLVVMFVEVMLN